MELEYTEGTTCCVTHHLVDEIGRSYPELLMDDKGNVDTYKTLYHLGFNVNFNMYNRNVSVHKKTLVRSNDNFEECYYTTVYKGFIRNAVDSVEEGVITYNRNKFHHMYDMYRQFEVLQPVNLSNYVSKDELLKIEDFGGKSKLSDCIIEEEI